MSILFGLLLARRFYCRSALSLSPGRTGGLLPRINAPIVNMGAGKLLAPIFFTPNLIIIHINFKKLLKFMFICDIVRTLIH